MDPATYVPAAGRRIFTPFYDLAIRAGMRERVLREHLLTDASVEPAMRIVDLACGTGSFAILVKQRFPTTEVIGVDLDEDVLAIARRKAERAGVEVRFIRQAITDSLSSIAPAQRVFASLVMHHLDPDSRIRALGRAHEALVPSGRIHVVDFGPPSSLRMRLAFLAIQILDGFETTRDCVAGTIPDHLRSASFDDIREHRYLDTAFGTVRFWSAQRRA